MKLIPSEATKMIGEVQRDSLLFCSQHCRSPLNDFAARGQIRLASQMDAVRALKDRYVLGKATLHLGDIARPARGFQTRVDLCACNNLL
jgi:hypothetical protein